MGRMVWKNGLFLPESQAVQSVYDGASLYGDCVFEMMRTFNKVPFRLDLHLDRLIESCRATYMPLNYTFRQLKMAHEDLLARNRHEFSPDDEIRTMVNVSRGVFPLYSAITNCEPWVMMTAFPLWWVLRGVSEAFTKGVHAITPSQRQIPAQFLDPKVKNRSRLHYRLAELEVKRADPNAWALLLDDQGYIAEGSGSNFFIVQGSRLITPEPRNCLRGISRNYTLSLARELGIDYRERNLEIYDAINADEAFFTGTPFSIMPVSRFNFQQIGRGTPSSFDITTRLTKAWCERVGVDWIEQVRKWDAERPVTN